MAGAKASEMLARRVNRFLRLQTQIRKLYEAADKLEEEILKQMEPGDVAGNGRMVDNFAKGNRQYRAKPFKRFEIEAV